MEKLYALPNGDGSPLLTGPILPIMAQVMCRLIQRPLLVLIKTELIKSQYHHLPSKQWFNVLRVARQVGIVMIDKYPIAVHMHIAMELLILSVNPAMVLTQIICREARLKIIPTVQLRPLQQLPGICAGADEQKKIKKGYAGKINK